MSTSAPSWDDFRRRMPVSERWAYFDHAAVAPLSGPARGAILDWCEDAARNGAVNWRGWSERVEAARRSGARLLDADPGEVALVHNTTAGVNFVAEGFPWQPGDNVVLPAGEFPTNLFPWLNLAGRGVEVRQVPPADPLEPERLDLDRLDAACDGRTRIVAASWVAFATGWRNDPAALAEVAHRHGALLFLDAIQGLGVLPLNVAETPVDFLAADGHKWLLGPEGAGLFYVRREHLDRLRPLGVGWNSVKRPGNFSNPEFDLKATADRYEGGSQNMAGVAALGASLDFLLEFGISRIAGRLLEVTDRLCARLEACGARVVSSREADRRSGIVSFELPGRGPQAVKEHCRRQGVLLNCRGGRLRASPHVYTNEEDLERLAAAIEGFPA